MLKTNEFHLGSISTATLREEDLIPRFMDELSCHDSEMANEIRDEYPDVFDFLDVIDSVKYNLRIDWNRYGYLIKHAPKKIRNTMDFDEFENWLYHNDYFPSDMQDSVSWLLNEDLFNKLNEIIPVPFVYFGSHIGDGADFGFWLDHESIEESLKYSELDLIAENDEWKVYLWDDETIVFLDFTIDDSWKSFTSYDIDSVRICKLHDNVDDYFITNHPSVEDLEWNSEEIVSV